MCRHLAKERKKERERERERDDESFRLSAVIAAEMHVLSLARGAKLLPQERSNPVLRYHIGFRTQGVSGGYKPVFGSTLRSPRRPFRNFRNLPSPSPLPSFPPSFVLPSSGCFRGSLH